jgi:hypothetical protein
VVANSAKQRAPINETPPPKTQANNASVGLPVCVATKAGVSKIPAPITMPTINAETSIAESVDLGSVNLPVIGLTSKRVENFSSSGCDFYIFLTILVR